MLVAAHEGSDEVLSEAELVAFVVILLLAGNETTTNLIGNGMLALTRHSGPLERLARAPELMPSAIEEMLRYDGPVQATMRYIRQDTEIAGTTVAAGSLIFVLLAAANRDPAQFIEPETFDIARTPNDHLAFGEGIHFCIGAPLARMEGAIAIGSLLARYKRIRPAPEAPLTYKGSFFLRGLASLPVEVSWGGSRAGSGRPKKKRRFNSVTPRMNARIPRLRHAAAGAILARCLILPGAGRGGSRGRSNTKGLGSAGRTERARVDNR